MMPWLIVLCALKDELADEFADAPVPAGGAAREIRVRHHRHRDALEEEWPAMSVRMMSNDVSEIGRQESENGTPELFMELAINLEIDTALPAEADEPGTPEDLDPTGYSIHGAVMQRVLDRLIPGDDEPNTLGGTTFDIRYDGSAPDDGDASPDYARLAERLTLIYRVRSDRPTELLTGN